ncbi:nuclear transcription factor Y subunit C-2 [Favolaschia claudopus]|uniref:Nuclear transcription factor Y subunit C-2 n=1 Tax=Favolaschia claudopus TaxID=2862362 RepID=A0AAW0DR13_9AGAR
MATQPYVQTGEPLNDFLRSFWQRQIDAAEQETPDYRHPPKVMKSDPDVKRARVSALHIFMCSCLIMPVFIAEITARAFIIADSNKRRTLSRADIAKALTKSDQFDFLIDIVPREEPFAGAASAASREAGNGSKRQQVPTAKREPIASSSAAELDSKSADDEADIDAPSRGSEVLEHLESLLAAGPAPRPMS